MFYDRNYHVLVLAGIPSSDPLHGTRSWNCLRSALDPLFAELKPSTVSVRSEQIDRSSGKRIPLLRLTWSIGRDAKWTHSMQVLAEREFLGTEVWSPSWNLLQRENRTPDIFVAIDGPSAYKHRLGMQVLVVAVASEPHQMATEKSFQHLGELSQRLFNSSVCARTVRPWGVAFARYTSGLSESYKNGIQDYAHYISGALNAAIGPLSVALLPGEWAPLKEPGA